MAWPFVLLLPCLCLADGVTFVTTTIWGFFWCCCWGVGGGGGLILGKTYVPPVFSFTVQNSSDACHAPPIWFPRLGSVAGLWWGVHAQGEAETHAGPQLLLPPPWHGGADPTARGGHQRSDYGPWTQHYFGTRPQHADTDSVELLDNILQLMHIYIASQLLDHFDDWYHLDIEVRWVTPVEQI